MTAAERLKAQRRANATEQAQATVLAAVEEIGPDQPLSQVGALCLIAVALFDVAEAVREVRDALADIAQAEEDRKDG